jgi:hypothetical protein
MFLIDTVTLSELHKRDRDPMVVKWYAKQKPSSSPRHVFHYTASGNSISPK